MNNPNTKSFWESKISKEKSTLLLSSIYNDKNIKVADFLKKVQGNLLNIGVGYGEIERLLSNKNPQINLFGVDIASNSISDVKKRFKGNFMEGSVFKIPFQKKFDYVLLLDVLEHFSLKEQNKIFIEIDKIIKRKGYLIISVPLNENDVDTKNNKHLVKFTETLLINLLKKKGYDIEKVQFLYAFKKYYYFKTFLNYFFDFAQPNLVIVYALKK